MGFSNRNVLLTTAFTLVRALLKWSAQAVKTFANSNTNPYIGSHLCRDSKQTELGTSETCNAFGTVPLATSSSQLQTLPESQTHQQDNIYRYFIMHTTHCSQ